MKNLCVCAALLFSTAGLATPGGVTRVIYQLDPASTEIRYTLHDPLHTVHGAFPLKTGRLILDPDSGLASGEIVINVANGATGNGIRDRKMKREILETQRYPEAVFTPDHFDGRIAPQGASQVDVHGVFRIHGADHELTLHFEVQANAGQYTASTHFTIPYVQWGMKNPSNLLLHVDDKVEMDVKAIASLVSLWRL